MNKILHVIGLWTLLTTGATTDDVAPNPPTENTLSGSPTHNDNETTRPPERVLPAFVQEQENAWFYETYYPIVLKLPIPDWSPDAHRLNRSAPRCENDDLKPNFMCPAQQHLDNLLISLSQSSRFFKNVFNGNNKFSTSKNERIYEDNPSCVKIRPHFRHHFSTTLKGMEPYLEELRQKCPLAKDLRMIEKTLASAEVSLASVRNAYARYTMQHNKIRPKDAIIFPSKNIPGNASASNVTQNKNAFLTRQPEMELWEFVQMTGFTTFQNIFTLFTYAESVQWSNAFRACQGYRLDVNLLPPQVLLNILSQASRNLKRMEYEISIPFHSLLTQFYKLPLADCVLAGEGASDAFLILRLLLPVTRSFKQYKLVKLNKVPFFIRQLSEQQHLHKEVGRICVIKNYRYEELFLVEYDTSMPGDSVPQITSVIKAPSTCGPYHVCRIPEQGHRSLVDTCVEGIISKNESVTREDCDWKCYPVSKGQARKDFPYVTQVSPNKFAVVGAMLNETGGKKVTIQCFGQTSVDGLKQEQSDKVTIVTLPCACQLSVAETTYYPESPCNDTLEIINVTLIASMQDVMNGSQAGEANVKEHKETRRKKGDLASEGDLSGEKKTDERADNLALVPTDEFALKNVRVITIPSRQERRREKEKSGTASEDFPVELEASGWDECTYTHPIMWAVSALMLIWELAAFYIFWRLDLISVSTLFRRRSVQNVYNVQQHSNIDETAV